MRNSFWSKTIPLSSEWGFFNSRVLHLFSQCNVVHSSLKSIWFKIWGLSKHHSYSAPLEKIFNHNDETVRISEVKCGHSFQHIQYKCLLIYANYFWVFRFVVFCRIKLPSLPPKLGISETKKSILDQKIALPSLNIFWANYSSVHCR